MPKYVVVFVLSLALAGHAQSQQPKSPAVDQFQAQRLAAQQEARNDRSPDTQLERIEREQVSQMIAERHSQLRRDTERLVALTAELKQRVDQAGTNILSMEVIKKAQEIQKLAKSVQDKMKNAY